LAFQFQNRHRCESSQNKLSQTEGYLYIKILQKFLSQFITLYTMAHPFSLPWARWTQSAP
jgi:hypothetical protein